MNKLDILLNRIHKEQEKYIEEIKQLSPEKIAAKAYEIYYREEFIDILKTGYFDDKTIDKLLKYPLVIDMLYSKWLNTDGSIFDMLIDVIDDVKE